MDLRAHHLLCMRSFQGKGYSREFVKNFYKVIDKLKRNPSITVVNRPDVICEKCPHNKNGCVKKGPKSELRVRKKDNEFIKALSLTLNKTMKANRIKEITEKITKEGIKKLCRNCQWLDYCVKK